MGEIISSSVLLDFARNIIGADHWPQFLERRSYDLSKTIRGVRCRINILQTARGIGFAIRLLSSFEAAEAKNEKPGKVEAPNKADAADETDAANKTDAARNNP